MQTGNITRAICMQSKHNTGELYVWCFLLKSVSALEAPDERLEALGNKCDLVVEFLIHKNNLGFALGPAAPVV